MDSKSMRGAGVDGTMPHLLAALDHGQQVVLAQRAVADKGTESPELKDLLAPMDLADVVVTADALHRQRDTATWLTDRGADFLLPVKGNRPGLRDAPKKLPWAKAPGRSCRDRAHESRVTHTIKAIEVPAWIHRRGAAQAAQVRRTRIIKGRKHVDGIYIVCPVLMVEAGYDITSDSTRPIGPWLRHEQTLPSPCRTTE